MPSPDVNGISSKLYSTSSSSYSNLKRTNEDLRKHVAKLKTELDAEKAKSKQIHRDKVAEIKKLKDFYDQERLKAIDTASDKSRGEFEQELKKVRESLLRSKEAEIKQILKFKEEELRTTRRLLIEERENAVREAESRAAPETSIKDSSDIEKRLTQELKELKKEKLQHEEMVRQHVVADFEKSEEIKRLKTEHDKELQRVARDNRKEFTRKLNEIKSYQRVIQEKNQELAKKDQVIVKLEQEKAQLFEQSGSVFGPDNLILSPTKHKVERTGTQASSDYCAKLERRIQDLKLKNGELVSLAKKLEEKARKLQEQNKQQVEKDAQRSTDFQSLDSLKRTYTMQRARDISEHAQIIMAKDKEISRLKASVKATEKRFMEHETKLIRDKMTRSQSLDSENMMEVADRRIALLEGKLAQHAKERLQLERQLTSSQHSSQVTVQSSEIKKLKLMCSKYENEKMKLQENLNELYDAHRKCRALGEEIRERAEECNLLKGLLQKSEADVHALNSTLTGALEECKTLKKQLETQKTDFETMKSEKEKVQDTVKTLQDKTIELQKLVEKLKQFETEVKELRIALEDSRTTTTSLQQEVKKLEQLLDKYKTVEKDLEIVKKELLTSRHDHSHAVEVIKQRDQEIAEVHKAQHEYQMDKEKEIAGLQDKVNDLTTKVSRLASNKCNCSDAGVCLQSPEVATKYLERTVFKSNEQSPELEPDIDHEAVAFENKSSLEPDQEHDLSAASDELLNMVGDRIAALAVSDSEDDEISLINEKDTNDENSKSWKDCDKNRLDFNNPALDAGQGIDQEAANFALNHGNRNALSLELVTSPLLERKNYDAGVATLDHLVGSDEEASGQDNSISGPINVYVAKYSYDPQLLSPNANPDHELTFEAGDHLYVLEDHCQDGFYLGELINGDRGLIPSNFVEKVNEQVDPLQSTEEREAPSNAQSAVEDFTEAEYQKNKGTLERRDSADEFSLSSLSFDDDSDQEEESKARVPAPCSLLLERQLSNSVVLSWQSPKDISENEVKGYAVYLNDQHRQTVIGSSRTKALISDVDPSKTYVASVTTVTVNGLESAAGDATLVIGKGPGLQGSCSESRGQLYLESAKEEGNKYDGGEGAYLMMDSTKPLENVQEQTKFSPEEENETRQSSDIALTIDGIYDAVQRSMTEPEGEVPVSNVNSNVSSVSDISGGSTFSNPTESLTTVRKPEELDQVTDDGEISEGSELSVIKEEPEESTFSSGSLPISLYVKQKEFTSTSNKGTLEIKGATSDKTYTIDSLKEEVKDKTFSAGPKDASSGDDSNMDVLGDLPDLPYDNTVVFNVGDSINTGANSDNESYVGEKIPQEEENRTQVKRVDDDIGNRLISHAGVNSTPVIETEEKGKDGHNSKDLKLTNKNDVCETLSPSNSDAHATGAIESRSPEGSDKRTRNCQLDLEASSGVIRNDIISEVSAATRNESFRSDVDDPALLNMYYIPENSIPTIVNSDKAAKTSTTGTKAVDDKPVNDQKTKDAGTGQKHDKVESSQTENDTNAGKDIFSFQVPVEIRVFIALFSYDPTLMSPNADAAQEELTFRQGDLIKIFGDMDEDGFYFGEINEQQGFVPSNMVQEVNLNDFGVAGNVLPPGSSKQNPEGTSDTEQRLAVQASTSAEVVNVSDNEPTMAEDDNDKSVSSVAIDISVSNDVLDSSTPFTPPNPSIFNLPPKKMVAMFHYDPQKLSPNVDSEIELGFNAGDVLEIYGGMDDDGFYVAKLNGKSGLVPSNFLRPFVEERDDAREIEIFANSSKHKQGSSRVKDSEEKAGSSQKKKKKGFLKKSKQIFSKFKGK